MKEILSSYSPIRKELIPILRAVQSKYGYVPPASLTQIAEFLKISEAEVFGVASFYRAFSLIPRGKFLIKVCLGTACHVKGARSIADELERKLGIKMGRTTPDGKFSLETVMCLGCCAISPVVVINDCYHPRVTLNQLDDILAECRNAE